MHPGLVELEREDDGVCVVRLSGEHDLNTAPELREHLGAAFAGRGGLVIDLSSAEFIDSSIIGVILEARNGARDAGRGFAIVRGGGEAVRRVFEITGLNDSLPVASSRLEAVGLASEASGGP